MSLFGPPLLGQQCRQAALLETRLRLVEGRPGEPEGGGRSVHRQSLGFDPAQHFVLDLNEIARIEKLACLKQFVGDPLGMRIQAALLPKGQGLGIGRRFLGHRSGLL